MKLSLKDSRGRESITLAFVAIAFLAETVVFVLRGTATDLGAYGAATAMTLAIWLGREGMEKFKTPGNRSGSATD